MDALTPAQVHLIQTWPEVLKPWSIPKAAARIHALLLSASHSLNAEEIKETLDLSEGSISTQLRFLEDLALIEKLRIIGSRRSRYQAPRDPARIFIALAKSRRKMAFKAMDTMGPVLTSIAQQEDLDWLHSVGQLRTLAQMMDQWLLLCAERDPEWTVKSIQNIMDET